MQSARIREGGFFWGFSLPVLPIPGPSWLRGSVESRHLSPVFASGLCHRLLFLCFELLFFERTKATRRWRRWQSEAFRGREELE